mmetsp:Transcript_5569/g.17068  ORF Transcript_5569/g.17068 Transcript_5569/m.17068 type:complete len:372 (+) Transcript_5569:2318-3433(+)
MHLLLLGASHPVGELEGVGHCGREEDHVHMIRQHDDHLLPDHASLRVTDVVYLVEDHPFYVSNQICPLIEHRTKDLGCHNQAGTLLVNLNVTSNQTHITKCLLKVPILLVTQRFDWRGVYGTSHMLSGHGNGVLSHYGFTGRSMRSNEHTLVALQMHNCLFLEGIQLERIFESHVRNQFLKVGHIDAFHDGPLLFVATLRGATAASQVILPAHLQQAIQLLGANTLAPTPAAGFRAYRSRRQLIVRMIQPSGKRLRTRRRHLLLLLVILAIVVVVKLVEIVGAVRTLDVDRTLQLLQLLGELVLVLGLSAVMAVASATLGLGWLQLDAFHQTVAVEAQCGLQSGRLPEQLRGILLEGEQSTVDLDLLSTRR